MALLLSYLALAFVDARPAAGAESPARQAHPIRLADRVLGKLLVWGVRAGLTPDDVTRVLGPPDLAESFTNGPIIPGGARTQTAYLYLRYGVSVYFRPRPPHPGPPGARAQRVRGGIQ